MSEELTFPPAVSAELPGWVLWWAELACCDVDEEPLAALRARVVARARASHRIEALADHPTVMAVRRLFRQAGCDPTRYRPSSEALLRRVLKGEELPAIHPLVDLNNCLSIELVVPACVMAAGSVTPPVTLRAGRAGETMASLRGPFDLAGKPLLADQRGPFGTPITDSERVRIDVGTRRAVLVAYLPAGVVTAACVSAALSALVAEAPVVTVGSVGVSESSL